MQFFIDSFKLIKSNEHQKGGNETSNTFVNKITLIAFMKKKQKPKITAQMFVKRVN